jgi:hypothetical protein
MSYKRRTVRVHARRKHAHYVSASPSNGIFFLILIWLALPAYVRGETSGDQTITSRRLADMVRTLRARLLITDNVEIQIDEKNDKMVSSEPLAGGREGYRISFDQHFLDMLDDEEIQAAIAHELGHVWIFSHHPYLQTEELANEIAMRAISRDFLKKVYLKLWSQTGTAGNLEELLGPEHRQEPPTGVALLPIK